MKHPNYVKSYNRSLSQLEEEISNLSFYSQKNFLIRLSDELKSQSIKDSSVGKIKLSSFIDKSSSELEKAVKNFNILILYPNHNSLETIADFDNFSLEELAYEVSIMTYDKVAEFIEGYSYSFIQKIDLADTLFYEPTSKIYKYLMNSVNYINEAWKICIPFMNEQNLDLKN